MGLLLKKSIKCYESIIHNIHKILKIRGGISGELRFPPPQKSESYFCAFLLKKENNNDHHMGLY
jgi:hypothetical protein